MVRFEKIIGAISSVQPERTFIDGVYCRRVDFTAAAHATRTMERIFFTNKLASLLTPPASGTFYFWNSHCFAFRSKDSLIEDIDGARASYFTRDRRLLLLLACSVILLPVAMYIVVKKVLLAGSRDGMERFLMDGSVRA